MNTYNVTRTVEATAFDIIADELTKRRNLFTVIFNKDDTFTVEVKKELPLKSEGGIYQFCGLSCDLYLKVMKEKRRVVIDIPQPYRTELLKFEDVLFEKR